MLTGNQRKVDLYQLSKFASRIETINLPPDLQLMLTFVYYALLGESLTLDMKLMGYRVLYKVMCLAIPSSKLISYI